MPPTPHRFRRPGGYHAAQEESPLDPRPRERPAPAPAGDGPWPALRRARGESPLGFPDLRADPGREAAPSPLARGDAEAFLAARARGLAFRPALEELLRALPEDRLDRLIQIRKEGRGAWFAVLCGGGGQALVLGNSLSGSVVPLISVGYRVTLLDPSPERLGIACASAEEGFPGRTRGLIGGDSPELPFEDGAFDLVVLEEGLPIGGDSEWGGPPLAELRRVCGGELFAAVDNRLAYKRSSGRTSDLRVPAPLAWMRAVARPARGERTLLGYRRALRGDGFAPARAFALYPDRRDFAQIVSLEGGAPDHALGPAERRNRLKMLGRALGLFPVLAPSFGLVSARRTLAGRPMWIERILAWLAERLGRPVPPLAHVMGTRGNACVVHTRAGESGDGWTLHVPMCARRAKGLARHFGFLELLRDRHPEVPAPEPLFQGEVEGVWLTCERRLPGWAAHHLAGDEALADRVLEQAAGHLAGLISRPAAPFGPADLEEHIEPRFELLLGAVREPASRAALEGLRRRAREELPGLAVPLGLSHGDLRAKHVQVDGRGRVLGYLDWNAAAREDLSYWDLLRLLVHNRKQSARQEEGGIWRRLARREGLRAGELGALELYRLRTGLDRRAARVLEHLYPVFVGSVAERAWAYSPPGWFGRQFGL